VDLFVDLDVDEVSVDDAMAEVSAIVEVDEGSVVELHEGSVVELPVVCHGVYVDEV
jgi:hypothetical protein